MKKISKKDGPGLERKSKDFFRGRSASNRLMRVVLDFVIENSGLTTQQIQAELVCKVPPEWAIRMFNINDPMRATLAHSVEKRVSMGSRQAISSCLYRLRSAGRISRVGERFNRTWFKKGSG